jgi:hypothetical protein
MGSRLKGINLHGMKMNDAGIKGTGFSPEAKPFQIGPLMCPSIQVRPGIRD